MAQDIVVTCPAGVWTQLTDADAAGEISIAVIQRGVFVLATANATPPTADEGFPLPYFANGWSQATIQEKFAGVTAAVRLWAKPIDSSRGAARVRISHA